MMMRQPSAVFLPGLFETAHVWNATIHRLGLDGERVMRVDIPGHTPGATAAEVEEELSSGQWLAALAERIADRFRDPPVVVGHSTGGLLGVALARHFPEAVRSLFLVGSLVRGDRERNVHPTAAILANPLVGPAAFRAALQLWLSTPTRFDRGYAWAAAGRRDVKAPTGMREQLAACDPEALRACAAWVLKTSVINDLAHVAAPIMALIGTSDPVVPARQQIAIVERAPKAHARLIEGGHLLFAECPEAVDSALRSWLLQAATPEISETS